MDNEVHEYTTREIDSQFEETYPEGKDQEIILFDSSVIGYFTLEAIEQRRIAKIREEL